MSVRMRDWMKFGALVAITFVFGLAFASALDLPKRSRAAEPVALPPTPAPGPTAQAPVQVSRSVADLSAAFSSVADHVRPAVVFIRSEHRQRTDGSKLPPGFEDFFQFPKRRPQVEQGTGSGFIV